MAWWVTLQPGMGAEAFRRSGYADNEVARISVRGMPRLTDSCRHQARLTPPPEDGIYASAGGGRDRGDSRKAHAFDRLRSAESSTRAANGSDCPPRGP